VFKTNNGSAGTKFVPEVAKWASISLLVLAMTTACSSDDGDNEGDQDSNGATSENGSTTENGTISEDDSGAGNGAASDTVSAGLVVSDPDFNNYYLHTTM